MARNTLSSEESELLSNGVKLIFITSREGVGEKIQADYLTGQIEVLALKIK